MLATTLGSELSYHARGEVGPAFGAARLARLALGDGGIEDVCKVPEVVKVIKPEADRSDYYQRKLLRYRHLYQSLKNEFKV